MQLLHFKTFCTTSFKWTLTIIFPSILCQLISVSLCQFPFNALQCLDLILYILHDRNSIMLKHSGVTKDNSRPSIDYI